MKSLVLDHYVLLIPGGIKLCGIQPLEWWKLGDSTDGGERGWVPILGEARCIRGQKLTPSTQTQCAWVAFPLAAWVDP